MAKWLIRTYTSDAGNKPVEEWVRSLDADARAAVAAEVRLLRTYGTELSMPHARYLGGAIWELRARSPDGTMRILYFHWKGRTFGLLHGFTKSTRATPPTELEIARRRRATWLARTEKRRSNDG